MDRILGMNTELSAIWLWIPLCKWQRPNIAAHIAVTEQGQNKLQYRWITKNIFGVRQFHVKLFLLNASDKFKSIFQLCHRFLQACFSLLQP